jgi:hypothetical protein
VGSAFVAGGSRRQRAAFAFAERRGTSPRLTTRGELLGLLAGAGLTDVSAGSGGFVVFRARRPA